MHKTTPDLTDEQVLDLAAGVRTRIDYLVERLAGDCSRREVVQAELGRQRALYKLLIGSDYE